MRQKINRPNALNSLRYSIFVPDVETGLIYESTRILLFASFAQGEAASPAKPSVPKGWKFSFPDGDPKAGKTVFMNMQCYSCHSSQIPGEKLPAGAAGIGPELTGYSALPKEYLAESIIKAHTVVAAPGYAVKEGKASMGNYNHFMTIQEMIDIVAFLKQGVEKR